MNTNTEREELAQIVTDAAAVGLFNAKVGLKPLPHEVATADAILAAGYSKSPKLRASDDALRTRLTDLLLAYAGTPRHELFEYPHRDSDSRAMISEAEAVVLNIIHTLNTPEPTK